MPKDQLQEMQDAAVQYGQKTQKWNPRMKQYLYGSKNGIHIIDLTKTQELLDKAKEFAKKMTSEGKIILFVSTKPQAAQLIIDAANESKMPYVVNKWIGGLLTNFDTLKKRIRYFKKLRDEEIGGDFDKYTKKEAASLRKDIVKLEAALGGVRDMEKQPDVVFIVDVVRDNIAVREAKKLNIPIIGIVDSNADPEDIDYPIPGNDDAISSLSYLISALNSAILNGKTAK